jgi:hypothetical protein
MNQEVREPSWLLPDDVGQTDRIPDLDFIMEAWLAPVQAHEADDVAFHHLWSSQNDKTINDSVKMRDKKQGE